MSPEHARLYAYVHPLFWGWLWIQLQLFTNWQRESHRPLLVAVTRWGNLYTVQIGDKVTTYQKPAPVKPGWDDPVWESALPPNMAGVSLEFSENPPTEEASPVRAGLLPRLRGRCPAGAEGGAPPNTS
ncbi:MAG: hypothetical protein ACK4M6_05645 [Hyphomonas sp.]